MVLEKCEFVDFIQGFRPLTGMVRERYDDNGHPYLFSPPYGDGTARVSHVRPLFAVFAPLRGWYRHSLSIQMEPRSFRPLTGMVPTLRLRSSSCMSFRPLTGMVPLQASFRSGRCGFRPLTGMVPHCMYLRRYKLWFSPPYGDGTH